MIKGASGPIIVNGKPYNNLMPPHDFTDEQTADVLTYVMNAWGNNYGSVTATEVRRVRGENK